MRRLSQIILLLGSLFVFAQSPHGNKLVIKCSKCHDPDGWSMNYQTLQFDHGQTSYELEGAHKTTDCRQCHPTLIFEEAPTQCIDCHTDVHNMSVGSDCLRCHTPRTWLVDNIPELHEENGFPLIGVHSNLSCLECHKSDNLVRFDRLGNDCINCHEQDYTTAKNPDHQAAGYSTNCIECHDPLGTGWDSQIVDHNFFPLIEGHDVQDCKQCHTTDNYADVSPDCVSCHQTNYAGTKNPNHQSAGFSTNCANCHTLQPGWSPAEVDHDFFALTLGHDIQDCKQCHTTDNYADASPDCVSCHQTDYVGTQNPDHQSVGYSTDCAACHTTNPGWSPAQVDHDFFPLTLGHDVQDCKQCHTSNSYADANPECVSCHQTDFDQTNDPDHRAAHFPTDCAACHTTNPGWTPATFDHDGQYFPIYSGKHREVWNSCTECHQNANNYAVFTCLTCHQQSETDNDHSEVRDYIYSSDACLQCHPDGNN